MNRAAIYELLTWDSGRFAFTQEDTSGAVDEMRGAPTTLLLVEAARRADEAASPAY